MTVLNVYLDPLRKDEINEYKVKGIQKTFYFWQYLCGCVIPVIQVDVDSCSKNRTKNLFLEGPIFRGSIFKRTLFLEVLFLASPIFNGSIFSSLYI
jgi:hypothetical protein